MNQSSFISEKIKQPEGRKLEFKQELVKSNLLKTIIAFANGAGGEVFIGVSDKREIIGVKDPLELEERISSMVYDSVSPLISPYISIIDINGKKLLHIEILSGSNKPYYLKSKGIKEGVFIRIGSSNRIATREIIEELQRQARGYSYEEEIIPSLRINDLDKDSLQYFINEIKLSKYDKELWDIPILSEFVKYNILKRNNGDYFPTVLGIILFGNPNLTNYGHFNVRLTRFNGIDYSDISKEIEFSIPLLKGIEKIINSLESMVKKTSELKGAKRIENTVIPAFALREVIINAIAHRDYSISSSIKVNVFDDRVEVINPGVLYGNLNIDDLGKGISESRNMKMAKLFRKIGFMEELGTGIGRIFELCSQKNLRKPEFQEQGNYFKAILFQVEENVDKAEQIYNLINEYDVISASEIAEVLQVHHNTVLYYLKKLIESGKIVKKGFGKQSVYSHSEAH